MTATETARAIFSQAAAEGRSVILEDEVYRILAAGGLSVPRTLRLKPGDKVAAEALAALGTERVILKVASPGITHKTEMGGVALCPADADEVTRAAAKMMETIRERGGDKMAGSVRWIQVTSMASRTEGLGGELFLGLRNTREFGPVLVAGFGGLDTEALASRFKPGQATVMMPLGLVTPEGFLELFKASFAGAKFLGKTRGAKAGLSEQTLLELFTVFADLAREFMSGQGSDQAILDMEINPFFVDRDQVVAVDGFIRLGTDFQARAIPPLHQIKNLLEPETVAIMGVSAKGMNPGRVILRNLLREKFPVDSIRLVRPGEEEIDGVKCVPTLADLPWCADMMVVAVAAEQVPDLLQEVVDRDRARSIVLIPGGMGETEHGKAAARAAEAALFSARREGRPSPVIVGPNCLGVRSRPGRFDTLFIPETKLPLPARDPEGATAMVFQSGAFMITRMNALPYLDPVYAVSSGNQMDLTTTDFVRYLADDDRIRVIALYIEGYGDLEGLASARAIQAARARKKQVVVYKAGRTSEGKTATSSHTASMAGEYDIAVAALTRAGAMVAHDFDEFRGLLMLASLLKDKDVTGTSLALMSNAGYETVGMADSIAGDQGFTLAKYQESTRQAIAQVLEEFKIARLVNVGNPLDLTPMAQDAVHLRCLEAILQDPAADGVVMGVVPMTPAMATLPPGAGPRDGIDLPGSLPSRLPDMLAGTRKSVVLVVDGGRLYDPMADALLLSGIPCFRSADRALRCTQRYFQSRLAD